MAPKKKTIHNGFMTFTREWRGKHGKGMSMREVTAAAGRVWENMSAQERQPYNEQAKQEKISFRSNEKLTCMGTPVSQVVRERQECEDKERKMKRTVENIVRNSVRRDELELQSYYFIMVNYFIKTQQGNVYVPAEISVSEYSLKNGVCRKYHTFINPDVTIFGYQYEAQQHSDTTHKLPLPPNAKGETNLGRIYNDVLKFIRNEETGEYPPLFTDRDSIVPVESVLEFLKADVGAHSDSLEVYSIQYLFYILKEATCEAGELEKPKSFYLTDSHFEQDFFEYEVGIACQYHEDCDRTKYCTLSYVTRWGFMFSDYMCKDIAISLIPGRHVPQRTNLAAVINPGGSSKASVSYYDDDHNDDSKSCMSIKTETTAYTSALSESKMYYDDKRSERSVFRSPSSRLSRIPNIPSRQDDSFYARRQDDLLEQRSNYTKYNPWATRSLRITNREPDDSHFSFTQNEDDPGMRTNSYQRRHRNYHNDSSYNRDNTHDTHDFNYDRRRGSEYHYE